MNDEEIMYIQNQLKGKLKLYMSIYINPEYNKAYADGMSDFLRSLREIGITTLGDERMIAQIFNELEQEHFEEQGLIH